MTSSKEHDAKTINDEVTAGADGSAQPGLPPPASPTKLDLPAKPDVPREPDSPTVGDSPIEPDPLSNRESSGPEASELGTLPTTILEDGILAHDDQSAPTVDLADADDERALDLHPTEDRLHLKLIRRQGRGAIGEVYVAYDERLSREVALKRMRRDLPSTDRGVRRFIREAKITAKLQHPGIVPIYDLDSQAESAHYTMPLYSGATLLALVDRAHDELGARPKSSDWMVNLRPLLNHFIAVCHAIDYANSAGVLHRDLKPSNIIVGRHGQTLVLDWGCAKYVGESEAEDEIDDFEGIETDRVISEETGDEMKRMGGAEWQNDNLSDENLAKITIAGSVLGTIGFMSPEQASGGAEEIGPASDVFGLGATLFFVLTGKVSVRCGEDLQEAIDKVANGVFRPVNEVSKQVPRPLVAICHRAMARRPKDRYASAGELGRDIDAFLAGEAVSAYREPILDRMKRFVHHHQTAVATSLGTFLVGFVALLFYNVMLEKQRLTLADKNGQLDYVNGQLETMITIEQELTAAARLDEELIERQLYETHMLLASEAATEPGGVGRMRELIDRWRGDRF